MSHPKNAGQSDSDSSPIDPGFQLTSVYRRRLTELSHAQYDVIKQSQQGYDLPTKNKGRLQSPERTCK